MLKYYFYAEKIYYCNLKNNYIHDRYSKFYLTLLQKFVQ